MYAEDELIVKNMVLIKIQWTNVRLAQLSKYFEFKKLKAATT